MTTSLSLLHLAKSPLKHKLLVYFLTQPSGTSLYLRQIAVQLNLDPANLSRELRKLGKEGIFISKKQGNLKYFSLNQKYPLYEELKSIARKTFAKQRETELSNEVKQKRTKHSELYVIAGPNGAGKTTFARKFLPEYVKCRQFVNADLIATGLSPFSPELAALSAGKLLIRKIEELAEKGVDFGFETTLSGKSYIPFLKQLREKGYAIHLFFLWIPTLELALARIRDRVQRGGHDIPEPVVRRRFYKGIKNLFHLYKPLLDSWMLFDNSGMEPHFIAGENEDFKVVIDKERYGKIQKIVPPEIGEIRPDGFRLLAKEGK